MTPVHTNAPEVVTVHVPIPPAPPVYTPPPVPPSPTVSLSRCTLCHALMTYQWVQGHLDWHKANGLHGGSCAALRSLTRRLEDPRSTIDACDCGLQPKEED